MPRARRRRRSRRAGRRSVGGAALVVAGLALVGVLVVGSIVEINAQSAPYRAMTLRGYGAMATQVVDASNRTGARLATVVEQAPTLKNQALPDTARMELEQGLDEAVAASSGEERTARQLAPPVPAGDTAARFAAVLSDRATAVEHLRTAIDQLLGMRPLAVAGAPDPAPTVAVQPSISSGEAATAMAAAGSLLERADAEYASLAGALRAAPARVRLPRSAWVSSPSDAAPLGPARLAGTAAALESSVALVPYHNVVVTAVGLVPPAVATGGPGIVGDSCIVPSSVTPGSTATVLPPTGTLGAQVTVTNCGTVTEAGLVVTETLSLADPPGSPLPGSGARGASAQVTMTLASGASRTAALPGLPVAQGHRYTLTVSVAPPAGQVVRTGTTQGFLVQIAS